MLGEVVEALRDREYRWNSWAVYTTAVIFYLALIAGPKTLGSAEGARDAHPKHSTLPFVVLQGQTNEEWRLIRISGEKFYIAQLRTDKENPRIRLIEGTSAEAIENRRPSPPQAAPQSTPNGGG
jgi:hypothetical protein